MRRLALLALPALAQLLLSAAPPPPREVVLFNGRNFDGWTFYLEEKGFNAGGKGKIADFAAILPGGVIEIRPQMHGALMTRADYLNFRLHAEWRFPDPQGANNSGLFVRIRPPFVWDTVHGESARQYMVQIQPPRSGDLWVLGYSENALRTDPARMFEPFGTLKLDPKQPGLTNFRRHVAIENVEKPAGEWNETEVEVQGKTIRVFINGRLVNEGRNLVDLPGRIGLEAEYGTVQFRNIRLTPL